MVPTWVLSASADDGRSRDGRLGGRLVRPLLELEAELLTVVALVRLVTECPDAIGRPSLEATLKASDPPAASSFRDRLSASADRGRLFRWGDLVLHPLL